MVIGGMTTIMPITHALLLPNHPLLLPGLTPEVKRVTAKTRAGLNHITSELKTKIPEVIFIIATVGDHLPTKINHNFGYLLQSRTLPYSFTEFGDLATHGELKINTALTHRLKESSETNLRLPQITLNKAPDNLAIPLISLGLPYSELPIVGLLLDNKLNTDDSSKLANWLEDWLMSQSLNILLVATGNIFQTSKDSPVARLVARQWQKVLADNDESGLMHLQQNKNKSHDTLALPALLLYQIIKNVNFKNTVISFENAAGAGLLVTDINLS